MSILKNRFELRLSDEHLRRLKSVMKARDNLSKSHVIRGLIDEAYQRCSNAGKR